MTLTARQGESGARSQEPKTPPPPSPLFFSRSQEPGARSQEPGARSDPSIRGDRARTVAAFHQEPG